MNLIIEKEESEALRRVSYQFGSSLMITIWAQSGQAKFQHPPLIALHIQQLEWGGVSISAKEAVRLLTQFRHKLTEIKVYSFQATHKLIINVEGKEIEHFFGSMRFAEEFEERFYKNLEESRKTYEDLEVKPFNLSTRIEEIGENNEIRNTITRSIHSTESSLPSSVPIQMPNQQAD